MILYTVQVIRVPSGYSLASVRLFLRSLVRQIACSSRHYRITCVMPDLDYQPEGGIKESECASPSTYNRICNHDAIQVCHCICYPLNVSQGAKLNKHDQDDVSIIIFRSPEALDVCRHHNGQRDKHNSN